MEENQILPTSMLGNIETPKLDRNKKIPEDLGAVIYDITNVVENFGNLLNQLKEFTSKRKKSQKYFLQCHNTYEEIIQQEHAILEPNEVDKLKKKIHGLKLENKALKIRAIHR